MVLMKYLRNYNYTKTLFFAIDFESIAHVFVVWRCRPQIIDYDKTIFLYFVPKLRIIW